MDPQCSREESLVSGTDLLSTVDNRYLDIPGTLQKCRDINVDNGMLTNLFCV